MEGRADHEYEADDQYDHVEELLFSILEKDEEQKATREQQGGSTRHPVEVTALFKIVQLTLAELRADLSKLVAELGRIRFARFVRKLWRAVVIFKPFHIRIVIGAIEDEHLLVVLHGKLVIPHLDLIFLLAQRIILLALPLLVLDTDVL